MGIHNPITGSYGEESADPPLTGASSGVEITSPPVLTNRNCVPTPTVPKEKSASRPLSLPSTLDYHSSDDEVDMGAIRVPDMPIQVECLDLQRNESEDEQEIPDRFAERKENDPYGRCRSGLDSFLEG